ncbi:hypothetical protein HQ571_03715 [Candidatus Kuenenbacteria bacterium]|nr:hypothetical protein [Candidatus Kuenenbacteria bacterium]
MKKQLFLITFFIAVTVFSLSAMVAVAQDLSKVTFPVAELGSCGSIEACKVYCDQPANMNACISFAEKKGLIKKEKAEVMKQVDSIKGPGGCVGHQQCEAYCDKSENYDECVNFGLKQGVITPEEAEIARKLGPNKNGPGGCKGIECGAYCDRPENFEECIAFAEDNGIISKEEAKMIKKMGNKAGPGGCKGKNECDTYCDNPANFDVCINFAVENGMMSTEEAEMIKKMGPPKEGPGGCDGKEQCDTYCDNENHFDECMNFASDHGLMSKEEIDMAKKMGPMKAGPGGCQGREECDNYCASEDHWDICTQFSIDNGFMSPEEAEMMKKGPRETGPGGCNDPKECEMFCQKPENMNECIDFSVKMGSIDPMKAEKMKSKPMLPFNGPTPGDCKGKECLDYCSSKDHFEECNKFAQEHGLVDEKAKKHFENDMPGMFDKPYDPGQPGQDNFKYKDDFGPPKPDQFLKGPGGCNNVEECDKYCREHPEECFKMVQPGENNFKPDEGPKWTEQERGELDHWGSQEYGENWADKKIEFEMQTGKNWEQNTEGFKQWVGPSGKNWEEQPEQPQKPQDDWNSQDEGHDNKWDEPVWQDNEGTNGEWEGEWHDNKWDEPEWEDPKGEEAQWKEPEWNEPKWEDNNFNEVKLDPVINKPPGMIDKFIDYGEEKFKQFEKINYPDQNKPLYIPNEEKKYIDQPWVEENKPEEYKSEPKYNKEQQLDVYIPIDPIQPKNDFMPEPEPFQSPENKSNGEAGPAQEWEVSWPPEPGDNNNGGYIPPPVSSGGDSGMMNTIKDFNDNNFQQLQNSVPSEAPPIFIPNLGGEMKE